MKKIFLSMLLVFAGLIFYLTSPLSVGAASVDLSTWGAESYSAVSGFPPGSWVVSGGGSYVDQINNGQPTIFYSNFSALGTDVSGKVQVRTTGDDDFMGFVLGFNPGDTTNSLADFILIDWKQITQDYNFTGNTATNATPGTTANAGLAVSRITGTPSADEIWGHTNFTTENPGGGVSELTRALTLGSTGWIDWVEYDFRFVYTTTNLKVYVDNILQADLFGSFPDGTLGFYNFSQDTVRYSAFTVDSAPIPEPATMILFGTGLIVIAGFGRKRFSKK